MASEGRPPVSVVIATRDRPQLVRAAIASVLEQDYAGPIEVVLVFDHSEPDRSLASEAPGRVVRLTTNARSPGLAGARNTGILQAAGPWIAFLDDDDVWHPQKLSRQIDAAEGDGGAAPMVTTSIEVDFDGRKTTRSAGGSAVTHAQLLRSRMSMLHSSTFLFRKQVLLDEIGLVSEAAPGSQNEDWDLLLRASRLGPIRHLDEPLVTVRWGAASFFNRTWASKVASLLWMIDTHPDLLTDRKGIGRVYAQIAFGEASQHHRSAAASWAMRALRRDPLQWRAWTSLAVAAGLVGPAAVLNALHRFGRGV